MSINSLLCQRIKAWPINLKAFMHFANTIQSLYVLIVFLQSHVNHFTCWSRAEEFVSLNAHSQKLAEAYLQVTITGLLLDFNGLYPT